MTLDQVKLALSSVGRSIKTEQRLPNDTGFQLRLSDGGIVNVFDSGSINCQGKKAKELERLLQDAEVPTAATGARKVFVVYGHDAVARDQLEAMLRRWDLEPLILDQLPSEGQTIIEKLESVSGRIGFGVVLATPDDEGHRAGRDDEKTFRARQNVVLELGMLLARLGRPRVAILLKQQPNMERPSDIQGLIYIPFKDDVKDAAVLLAKELNAQGYPIDIQKL